MIVLSKNINRNDKHCLMKTIDSAFYIVKEEKNVKEIIEHTRVHTEKEYLQNLIKQSQN